MIGIVKTLLIGTVKYGAVLKYENSRNTDTG